MVIKLIQPRMQRRPMDTALKIRMSPPLGLLTMAGMLRPAHTVILENENVVPIQFDQPADLVCISVTVDVMPRAVEIARQFRRGGVPVAAGGIHISADPGSAAPYFDALCIGMAEGTLPQLVTDLQNGRLQKIYRCAPMDGGQIQPPDYSAADRKQYLFTNVLCTSRGCPFQCDFCYNSCEAYQGRYVNRPVGDIIREIQSLGRKHIMFIDDNLAGNPGWLRELLRAIRPLGLQWNAAVSANIVDMPDLLDEMRDTGCKSLFIGLESLNAASVQGVNKGQNHVDRFEPLIEALHARGIMLNASFVFGLDGDAPSVFQATLDFIVKNRIETVTSHIMTPYPGTRLYQSLEAEGRILDRDLSHYTTANVVFQPRNMTPKQLYDGYLWIYKQIYSLPNILRRTPRDRRQWPAYFAFNLLYRKYGWLTEKLCALVGFGRIGRFAGWVAYHRAQRSAQKQKEG